MSQFNAQQAYILESSRLTAYTGFGSWNINGGLYNNGLGVTGRKQFSGLRKKTYKQKLVSIDKKILKIWT